MESKELQPNTQYGYDHPITLCLRGVTKFPFLDAKCEPVDIDLKGAKISTDENGNPTLESWEEVVFLNEDGSIKRIDSPYMNRLNVIDDYTDGDKVLYEIYIPEDSITNYHNCDNSSQK